MIKGYLSNFGYRGMIPAPAVQGLVYLDRLSRVIGWTHFLIDTGASATCLHGPMAFALQADMQKSSLSPSRGIGGDAEYYCEKALVIFTGSDGGPLPFEVELHIQKIDTKHPVIIPSLLGRDVLWLTELTVGLKHGKVLMDPLPKKTQQQAKQP